jgi:hypothetical protein
VRRDDGVVDPRRVGFNGRDQAAKLVRQVPARRVGDVERRRAGGDDLAEDAVQELGLVVLFLGCFGWFCVVLVRWFCCCWYCCVLFGLC